MAPASLRVSLSLRSCSNFDFHFSSSMITHYYWYITMSALLLRAAIYVPMYLFEHHLACDLVSWLGDWVNMSGDLFFHFRTELNLNSIEFEFWSKAKHVTPRLKWFGMETEKKFFGPLTYHKDPIKGSKTELLNYCPSDVKTWNWAQCDQHVNFS